MPWADLYIYPRDASHRPRDLPATLLATHFESLLARFWSSLPCFCCSWEPKIGANVADEPLFSDCPVCTTRMGVPGKVKYGEMCDCGVLEVDCNQGCATHGCLACCFAGGRVWGRLEWEDDNDDEPGLICQKSFPRVWEDEDVMEEMGRDPECRNM